MFHAKDAKQVTSRVRKVLLSVLCVFFSLRSLRETNLIYLFFESQLHKVIENQLYTSITQSFNKIVFRKFNY